MDILHRATTTTEQIRDALTAEIAVARHERVLIREMNVDGLNLRAAKRAEFNLRLAELQRQLGQQLGEAGRQLGLPEVTLESLKANAPTPGRRMADLLAEVRALAGTLSELDGLNRMLGQRALAYVRAHLTALDPRPSAYDRRGATTPPRASTVRRVA